MENNKTQSADFLNEMEEQARPAQEDVLVFNVLELNFSVGEIFWTMNSGKKITLFHPGDWVRKDYLQKFINAKKTIEINPIINNIYCSEGLTLFKLLKGCAEEKEKAELRDKIIEWLSSGFWDGSEKVSLLDLVFVCEQSFFEFSEAEQEELFNASSDLFKRSSVVSGLMVCLSIVLGHTDASLLKDLYHLCYLFDISLDEEVLSSNLITALEQERVSPKAWHTDLNPSERKFFISHPKDGVVKASKVFEKRINNLGLLNFIETHHERVNGEGFPLGLVEGEISDLEGLIIFINNRFPYENLNFKLGDGCSFIRKLMEKGDEVEAVLLKRIKKMITNEFDNKEMEHAKYLEVSGI